ncbi:hypothetical protein [Thalassospira indica]|uniref:HEPN domain-containing protein n=1 Tax=Thalassospira indica TaxID=1891279 RepID=A0ABM6XYJ2_9PROT|nr:hypothetical protein [Thalassospira indica]AXO13057.1 hypothetical protein DY252_01410 [Thalassospira indica]
MADFEVTKIQAAVLQLNWSIRLFLDHEAYIPSITLAAAAEEILGKCVDGSAAHATLKKRFSEEFQLKAKLVSDEHLNKVRNWLKHNQNGDPFEKASIDLENEAIQFIARALFNLTSISQPLPSEGQRFLSFVGIKQQ